MTLQDYFRIKALKLALRKGTVVTTIPRSLPRAAGVDIFVVQIGTRDRDWFFLADRYTDQGLIGRYWNDDNQLYPACLPLEGLGSYLIEYTHHINVYDFNYTSAIKFYFQERALLPRFHILFDRLNQKIFNQRRLIRKERIEVLRLLTERSIQDSKFQVSYISLMNYLYSPRWIFHPEKDQMSAYCRLLLDSFASTGEILSSGAGYKLQAKALATLSAAEEEDRRHRDMVSQQAHLKWLTVALVFVGIAQAAITWLKP